MNCGLTLRSLLFCLQLGLLAGCVVPSQTIQPMPQYDPELLSGRSIFGEPVKTSESPEYDLLHMTPEMYDFVGGIAEARLSVMRFNRLVKQLRDTGFFDNVYDATVTKTASDTFESKVGNCISYTNLFVALARASDLNVHYQIVDVDDPSYNVDTGLLIRNNHINVVVEGPRFDRHRASGYTIDFNLVDPDPYAKVRKVSDEYAASLFYANLAVDEILKGNDRIAFSYMRRSIESEPRNADLWVNLGAFYGRNKQHAQAIEAYRVAQQLDSSEKMVLSGLERSFRALGEVAKAEELGRKVNRYRQQNPFFHFAVAQTAYEDQNYKLSLASIDKAIRLKHRYGRFHFLRSLAQHQLGDTKAAGKSLRRAKRYGQYDDLELRYGGLDLSLNVH